MELHLKRFDMRKIKQDQVVVCIGRRGSGKSWAVRELLSHHASIPTGMVISPTESANSFFSTMIPRLLIHDEYTPEAVDCLVSRQKAIVTKHKEEAALGAVNPIDPRAFAILDDCNFDSRWLTDPNIRYLFMNGRHIKVLFILTMQYSLGLPPNLRTNVDYVFLFRETNINNRKRLYDNYAGCIPSFEVFCQVLDRCTEDHDFLVIDNTCKSNNLSDQIFWGRASKPGSFQMCSPKLWELSQQALEEQKSGHGANQLYDLDKLRKVKHRVHVVKKK